MVAGSVPDMPGMKAEGGLLHSFRAEVAQLLNRHSLTFPGAQPVSFASKHLIELQKQDYYVCEKSDGIRCLMYLTDDGHGHEITYLIDRKNDYYHVTDLHFPKSIEQAEDFHTGTLVDGELVNDRQSNGTIQLNYLVFDCLVLDGSSLMHRTLDKRLAYFRDKVYNPYKALYKMYPQELEYVPFRVEFKKMEFGYGIEMMFRSILPNLPHGNDGLIFTCRNTPYQHGTDQHILKWKFENENSIDFRLFFEWPLIKPNAENQGNGVTEPCEDYRQKPTFHLAVHKDKDEDISYGIMTVEDNEWEEMKAMNEPLDERIVECYLDKQKHWRFLRWRNDKHDANHITTVNSVMESIEDSVSEAQLIASSRKIREEWKKRAAEEEARAKADAATKRIPNGHAQTNGHREVSVKRKFEASEEDPSDEAKRQRAP